MILLEHHKSAKREIINRFQQLADVADGVGMVTLARDIRTTRIPKLEAERFHLVVLGEFNHGKSTFVNAMLGTDVLPTGITPTTASINHVVHAGQPSARVVLMSGESKTLGAMVKLELGLEKGSAFNAEEYLKSIPDTKKGLGRFGEMFRSHPYVPKRVQMLRLFADSAFYQQLIGNDPSGKPSLPDVDKQVTDLISLF